MLPFYCSTRVDHGWIITPFLYHLFHRVFHRSTRVPPVDGTAKASCLKAFIVVFHPFHPIF
jgi:hypothetical protein